ncbi:helix-turn-helix domain-containing protein [Saccharopolyspora shandongensis]|uniref:sigma-54-dependent Fis family transcriptional regulator n=1 Tax=Saccharopolyspora shandongensis TaxID=418495 RepID=UPI003419C5DE
MLRGHDRGILSLEAAHDRFFEVGEVSQDAVRRAITESWRRSQAYGVDIDDLRPPYNCDIDVESRLLRAAQPVLDRLEQELSGVSMSVILTDANAWVIARCTGDRLLDRKLDRIQLAPGFSYAEQHVGTNGIGSAIEAGRAFHVFGSEHFSGSLRNFSCSGAPIRNPLTGQLIGIIDVTCKSPDATPLMSALVQEAARDIEQRLLDLAGESERVLLNEFLAAHHRKGKAIVTISNDVVISNAAAAQMLDPSDHVLLREKVAELTSSGHDAVGHATLNRGHDVTLRCRPIFFSSERAGAVLEISHKTDIRKSKLQARPTLPQLGLKGSSPVFRNVCSEVEEHCWQRSWVLITGEPGVGKLALAQAAHRCCFPAARLVVVDAVDLTRSDGDQRRSLGVELGECGTLVFRHVDRLSPAMARELVEIASSAKGQAGGPWGVATANNPGAVDADLMRMFSATVTVPPLRHRADDIAELVPELLRRLAGRDNVTCGAPAMRILQRALWPNNVTELAEALRAALKRRRAGEIAPRDLPESCQAVTHRVLTNWEALERDALVRALNEVDGDKMRAASLLGISRATIYRKIKLYGISA